MKKTIRITALCLAFLTAVCATVDASEKLDRGMSFKDAPVFMPKGNIMFGGTVSYRDYSFYDYRFLILQDMIWRRTHFRPHLIYIMCSPRIWPWESVSLTRGHSGG